MGWRFEAKIWACRICCPKKVLSLTSTVECSTRTDRLIASTAGSEGSARTILDMLSKSDTDSDACTRSESSLRADRLSFSIQGAETTKSHFSSASARRNKANSVNGPFSLERARSISSSASIAVFIVPSTTPRQKPRAGWHLPLSPIPVSDIVLPVPMRRHQTIRQNAVI